MKIKNVSAKVIGVFGRDLMPDESMTCNQNMVENLAVATMLKMGFLQLDDSAEKQKALEEEIRQKILKEQEEAAAKKAAEEAAAAAAENAGEGEADEAPEDPEAPEAPKRTRRTTKPTEPAAE